MEGLAPVDMSMYDRKTRCIAVVDGVQCPRSDHSDSHFNLATLECKAHQVQRTTKGGYFSVPNSAWPYTRTRKRRTAVEGVNTMETIQQPGGIRCKAEVNGTQCPRTSESDPYFRTPYGECNTHFNQRKDKGCYIDIPSSPYPRKKATSVIPITNDSSEEEPDDTERLERTLSDEFGRYDVRSLDERKRREADAMARKTLATFLSRPGRIRRRQAPYRSVGILL